MTFITNCQLSFILKIITSFNWWLLTISACLIYSISFITPYTLLFIIIIYLTLITICINTCGHQIRNLWIIVISIICLSLPTNLRTFSRVNFISALALSTRITSFIALKTVWYIAGSWLINYNSWIHRNRGCIYWWKLII
jgi:c-di-AMP phosphodiesterase-like protein